MGKLHYSQLRLYGTSRRRFLQYGAIAAGTGFLAACANSATNEALSVAQSPASGLFQTIKQRGYFAYGLEAGYCPFEFYDENNQLIGYDIDLAAALGKQWGVEGCPTPTNWATVIQTLYDGGFDMILGGMTATEERYKRVNFSTPYMDASSGLLVRSGEGIADRTCRPNGLAATLRTCRRTPLPGETILDFGF
jgi:ABC-type amino acid transport substrate-binding protein